MPDTSLQELLDRNDRHVSDLPKGYFDAVKDGQKPAAVSICCSDSRVSQTGMWDVEEPGWLFTPSTIGNQVWDMHDGEKVVDGSVLYPIASTATDVTVVVGHTGCGAITAALEAVRGSAALPSGITKWVDLLVPVVNAGLEDDRINANNETDLVNQLVEFNVDQQIAFLQASPDIPEDEKIYGFVYDFQEVYGETPGRTYLVNVNGETRIQELKGLVPDHHEDAVKRLLPAK